MTLAHKMIRFLAAASLGTALLASPSRGAPPSTLSGSAALCDPWSPQNCSKPNSTGELPVTSSEFPTGSTVVNVSSGNVANASAVASMPAVAGKTNYMTGFQLTAGGATAGACVTATVTGLIGGTQNYTFCAATGPAVGSTPLDYSFWPPLPASAANTAITVTLPALGAGNTNATASVQGYNR